MEDCHGPKILKPSKIKNLTHLKLLPVQNSTSAVLLIDTKENRIRDTIERKTKKGISIIRKARIKRIEKIVFHVEHKSSSPSSERKEKRYPFFIFVYH